MKHPVIQYLLVICSLLLFPFTATSQGAVGSWRSHLAYNNATQCVTVGERIYVVSDGSLYSYMPKDEFIESYDKTTILNDQGIRHIAVDEQTNTLIIIYNNANIDLIAPDGKLTNITDYTNKTTLDPTINDIRIEGGYAYLSTNFGLTVLNIIRKEFGGTYMLKKITNSSVELDGIIYAATAEGIYSGNKRDNLQDIANWKKLNNDVYDQLTIFDGELIALRAKESLYLINTTNGANKLLRKGPFHFMHKSENKLVVGNRTYVFVYESLTNSILLTLEGKTADLTIKGSTYWVASGADGLNGYRYDKESKTTKKIVTGVTPNSPIRNYCQYLNFVDDGRLLIAGGCLNYFDDTFFDGTLMMYDAGRWTTFQEEGIAEQTGVWYKNMTSIVQDPTDESHHYASSFGQGIYEFRDLKLIAHHTDTNSGLESVIPGTNRYTRVCQLQYDKQGNLWITNGHAESPLKIMKSNGDFIDLYYDELKKLPTVTEVLFDSRGWVWVVSMRYDVRLFCIDLNGTLENTADDRVRTFNEKFIDQDGQSIEVYYINDIAEDLNGDLWVMTDKGPYVLYNARNAFDKDYHFTKIKVPRNDGTNYADYLLDGAYTTCIEIDAANRKWIGTLNNGLYLISADGLEEIHHFDKNNTPLPSSTIESLALHHQSGELFIGTNRGLMSYMSDATRPEESYNEENVYAYPNPITPDYNGPITIIGLKTNSNIKIINTAGRLIAEGTSLGGSFTWDGKTHYGQRVATGIYYVLGCDEGGNEGIVTKILFVK